MQTLLEVGLSNAAAATALAVVALVGARCCRHRAVTHALWLLVLVKLVTPPLVPVHLSWPSSEANATTAAPVVVLEDIETGDRPMERPAPAPLDRATVLAEIELLEKSASIAEPATIGTLEVIGF